MLDRIVAAEARPAYHVWIRFEDGLEGEVSLAHLVGEGVFAQWTDESEFRKVFVDEQAGTIAWPWGVDLAPDTLHQRLLESISPASFSA
jgi:hypothetical protein